MTAVVGWLLFALVLGAFWFVLPIHRDGSEYRYDEHNPYRRYCARCGQQQDSMCLAGDQGNTRRAWWEATGYAGRPECDCHNDCGA